MLRALGTARGVRLVTATRSRRNGHRSNNNTTSSSSSSSSVPARRRGMGSHRYVGGYLYRETF